MPLFCAGRLLWAVTYITRHRILGCLLALAARSILISDGEMAYGERAVMNRRRRKLADYHGRIPTRCADRAIRRKRTGILLKV